MSEDPDVTTFDAEVEKAWTDFEQTLVGRLEALEEDGIVCVQLDLPEHGVGATPYVQFCAFGGGGMRCEVSSNYYLAEAYQLSSGDELFLENVVDFVLECDDDGEPAGNYFLMTSQDDSASLVADAIQVLREVFNVIHPSMLVIEGGADVSTAVLPDPADMDNLDLDSVYPVENPWDATMLVHRAIYLVHGDVVERDSDGDWPLTGLAHVPIFVTVLPDRPVVRIWTRLVHSIADHDAALREVNILNRDAQRIRYFVNDSCLWIQADFHSAPFVPRLFQVAVGSVAEGAQKVTNDFALRTGGTP